MLTRKKFPKIITYTLKETPLESNISKLRLLKNTLKYLFGYPFPTKNFMDTSKKNPKKRKY